jgi:hypothetical protein
VAGVGRGIVVGGDVRFVGVVDVAG